MKSLPFFILLLLLPGCLTLYKPNSINSPQLREKGEFTGSASLGASGCAMLNLQTAYAVGHDFGFMLNGMYHSSSTTKADSAKQSLDMLFGEFGVGLFQPINKKAYFQCFGGMGMGRTNGDIENDGNPPPKIKANYFNIFLQPGIFYASKYVSVAFDLRLNYVNFYNVDAYKYINFEWWDTDFGGNGISECNFVVAEPTATLKFGSENLKFLLQGGITIPVINKNSYFDINTSSVWGLPMLKFSFGFSFNFGASKSTDE